MITDLCDERMPAACSALSSPGSESPPTESEPILSRSRRVIPSQSRLDRPFRLSEVIESIGPFPGSGGFVLRLLPTNVSVAAGITRLFSQGSRNLSAGLSPVPVSPVDKKAFWACSRQLCRNLRRPQDGQQRAFPFLSTPCISGLNDPCWWSGKN